MDEKTTSTTNTDGSFKVDLDWTIEEFAQATVSARKTSISEVLRLFILPYATKSAESSGEYGSLFITANSVIVFPNTWKDVTAMNNGLVSYATGLKIKSAGAVEVSTYISTDASATLDNPSSTADYPIEAFLTPECVYEFWVKHPIPVWSMGDEISYMRYPFWVYMATVLTRLYSDMMRKGN